MQWVRRIPIIVQTMAVLLTTYAACSGGGRGGEIYRNVEQLAADLTASGFPCDDLTSYFETIQGGEGYDCHNDDLRIVVYPSEEDVDQVLEELEHDPDNFSGYLFGPNWRVEPRTPAGDAMVEEIAEELGGEIQ